MKHVVVDCRSTFRPKYVDERVLGQKKMIWKLSLADESFFSYERSTLKSFGGHSTRPYIASRRVA